LFFEGLLDSGVQSAKTDWEFLIIHKQGIESVFAVGELDDGFVAAPDRVIVF